MSPVPLNTLDANVSPEVQKSLPNPAKSVELRSCEVISVTKAWLLLYSGVASTVVISPEAV